MAKMRVMGSEITDADIEMISLVKHGANRVPFRILKAEDIAVGDGTMDKITKTLSGLFGSKDKKASVAAVFVRKSELARLKPELEKQGISLEKSEESNGFLVFPQAGFVQKADEDPAGTLVAVSSDLGFMLDRICKDFSVYPGSQDFTENVVAAGFFPGLHNGLDSLVTTVWHILDSVNTTGEAVEKIDDMLDKFKLYVLSLVSNLPEVVFKMDKFESLHDSFEASTLLSTGAVAPSTANPTEDGKMTVQKTDIKEAVPGDLAGLTDTVIKDDKATTVATAATGKAVEAGVVAPTAVNKEDTPSTVAPVVSTVSEVKPVAPTLEQALAGLADVMGKLGERLEKLEKAQGDVKELAEKAITKADSTVVHTSFAYDESLGSRSRRAALEKGEQSPSDTVWDGILPEFEGIIPRQ